MHHTQELKTPRVPPDRPLLTAVSVVHAAFVPRARQLYLARATTGEKKKTGISPLVAPQRVKAQIGGQPLAALIFSLSCRLLTRPARFHLFLYRRLFFSFFPPLFILVLKLRATFIFVCFFPFFEPWTRVCFFSPLPSRSVR